MASPGVEPMSARKLNELRVIDLKAELDKRGIEKTGVKASLIERLRKAIEDEGNDPDEFVFEPDMKKGQKAEADAKEKEDKLEEDGDADEEEEEEEQEEMDTNEADNTLTEESAAAVTANGTEEEKPKESTESEQAEEPTSSTESVQPTLETTEEEKTEEATAAEEEVTDQGEEKEGEEISMTIDEDEPLLDEDEELIIQDEANITAEMEATSTAVSENAAVEEESTEKVESSGDQLKPVSEPPSPSSVPVVAPFTSEDTVTLSNSTERQMDEDISLIVHVDESQMDLDNDLLKTNDTKAGDTASSTTATAAATTTTTTTETKEMAAEEGAPASGEEAVTADTTTEPEAATTESSEKSGDKDASNDGEKKTEDEASASKVDGQSSTQSKDGDKAKSVTGAKPAAKEDKAKSAPASSRNLWISGLASTTRATDLKTLFTKYGKVAGAKVVTNAKSPGSRCYGFVTMSTADEASKCIQHLHRTELHGKMISVERAKTDPSAQAKVALKPAPGAQKKDDGPRDRRPMDRRSGGPHRYGRGNDRDRHMRSHSSGDNRERRSSGPRRPSPGHEGRKDDPEKKQEGGKEVLDFDKIRAERERERLRERERRLRAEERRRIIELERMKTRQRDVERKQREESIRLEREKQRLKLEQQRFDLERLEAERERIALERERQRRERERLEREREQERQTQLRLEQERRAMKRNFESRGQQQREEGGYWNESKRPNMDRGKDSNVGPRGPKHEERNTNEFERRVERYDRREGSGRSNDQPQRGNNDRYNNRRDDRHDNHRDPPPNREAARDRDDRDRGRPSEDRPRNTHEGRYDRYEDRRDTAPPPRNHDNRNRHERDRSPHRPAPMRSSPAHRPSDTRADWKNERAPLPPRESRERRPPPANDRSFSDNRTTQNRDSGNWHNNRGNNAAQDDRPKSHYSSGPTSLLGNAPSSINDHSHQWSGGDRGSQSGTSQQLSGRPADRGWTGTTSQTTERVNVRPQPAAIPVQQPLLQTPPTSAAFLASAANIMMGVGLASNRNTTQDARYDAYKNLQGGNVRRY